VPSGKLWAFEIDGDKLVGYAGPFTTRAYDAVDANQLAYADGPTLDWAREHRGEFEAYAPSGGAGSPARETAPRQVSDEALAALLADARGVTRAEAGTVFVREGTLLRFAATYNDVLEARLGPDDARRRFENVTLSLDERSVASYVLLTHTAVNVPDVYEIPAGLPYVFNPQSDRRNDYRTRSVLTLPLRDVDGRVFGVVQLINPHDASGQPVPFDNELVRRTGLLLADWMPRLVRHR
jgi:hypothetical protein